MDSLSISLFRFQVAAESMGYWLNVDRSTKVAKLHRETCIWCRPHAQSSKGVNEMTNSGGWYGFESPVEAKRYCRDLDLDLLWSPCRFCIPE
jgi:hypothetical protein